MRTAAAVRRGWAKMLRGGAFKPRTSPYAFQGLGLKGLKILDKARGRPAWPIRDRGSSIRATFPGSASTPTCCRSARATCRIFPSSARRANPASPYSSKRGMYSTLEEWPQLRRVHPRRGAMTKSSRSASAASVPSKTYTRNTLDLSMVPAAHAESNLAILVDPSHGTGIRYMIEPMKPVGSGRRG